MTELVNLILKISKLKIKIQYDLSKPEGRFIKSSNSNLLQNVIDSENIETINLISGLGRMMTWYEHNFKKD